MLISRPDAGRQPQYLTVSLPPAESPTVTGIETVVLARGLYRGRAHLRGEGSIGERQTWRLDLELRPELAPADSDFAAHGTGLEVGRKEREDPDDRFLRLLEGLGCGDTVTMEYVRDGERGRVSFRVPVEPE